MEIYPAIDLRNGDCVRLYQGDFAQVTTYSSKPLEIAKLYANQGAKWLHVVDLDGTKNHHKTQLPIIQQLLVSNKLKIQYGGGVRTKEQIKNLLNLGITRVAIGSLALKEPHVAKQLLDEFGPEKIVIACDVVFKNNEPYIAICGWQEISNIKLFDLIADYQHSGLKHVLCTDISRDGTLNGPNIDLYADILQHHPNLQIQASGGIANLVDLKSLGKIPVAGAIIGRALYEKKFTLQEALTIC